MYINSLNSPSFGSLSLKMTSDVAKLHPKIPSMLRTIVIAHNNMPQPANVDALVLIRALSVKARDLRKYLEIYCFPVFKKKGSADVILLGRNKDDQLRVSGDLVSTAAPYVDEDIENAIERAMNRIRQKGNFEFKGNIQPANDQKPYIVPKKPSGEVKEA